MSFIEKEKRKCLCFGKGRGKKTRMEKHEGKRAYENGREKKKDEKRQDFLRDWEVKVERKL